MGLTENQKNANFAFKQALLRILTHQVKLKESKTERIELKRFFETIETRLSKKNKASREP